MRKGFPSIAALLFIGAGVAIAQPAAPPSPMPADQPAAPSLLNVPTDIHGGPGCVAEGCDVGGGVCGPPGRFWASAEYLLWWSKETSLPPLVTTSPPSSAGVLGAPGTVVIAGGSESDHNTQSGARFTVGYWLNECQTFGIEASYFFLGTRSHSFTTSSPGSPVLARPFFDISTGAENAELIAFPGLLSGSVGVFSESRLLGSELNALCNLCCCCNYRVDALGGFRYLELHEGLAITENIQVGPTVPTFGGSTIGVIDQFNTHNRFYGGQVGLFGEVRRNRFFVDLWTKLGLGVTEESVDINGATVITPPGGTPTLRAGGLLALPSNSGHFSHDEFSVVPEITLNFGYQVTNYLRVWIGYTFLYWSDVVRPADQIDFTVNSTMVPTSLVAPSGPARPFLTLRDTDYWAQGINFGIEFRY